MLSSPNVWNSPGQCPDGADGFLGQVRASVRTQRSRWWAAPGVLGPRSARVHPVLSQGEWPYGTSTGSPGNRGRVTLPSQVGDCMPPFPLIFKMRQRKNSASLPGSEHGRHLLSATYWHSPRSTSHQKEHLCPFPQEPPRERACLTGKNALQWLLRWGLRPPPSGFYAGAKFVHSRSRRHLHPQTLLACAAKHPPPPRASPAHWGPALVGPPFLMAAAIQRQNLGLEAAGGPHSPARARPEVETQRGRGCG